MNTLSGQYAPIGLGWGLQAQDLMTLPVNSLNPVATPALQAPDAAGNIDVTATDQAAAPPRHNYLLVMLGIVVLLIVLKYASEHEKSGMQPSLVGIGLWNWIVVTIMAVLGLATAKTLVMKYPVKGLTEVIGAA